MFIIRAMFVLPYVHTVPTESAHLAHWKSDFYVGTGRVLDPRHVPANPKPSWIVTWLPPLLPPALNPLFSPPEPIYMYRVYTPFIHFRVSK
jgi:hypothetical protein